jgi:hypothetical protein
LCSFLHFPDTSSVLGPNILLRTLFSNTRSLCSSLSMKDQVSHPYKTTGWVMVYGIIIFPDVSDWPVVWSTDCLPDGPTDGLTNRRLPEI